MADIAKLQIIVDSSQVKAANQNLQNFSRTSGTAERSAGRLSKAMGALSRVIIPLMAAFSAGTIVRAADEMTLLQARVKQSTRDVKEFSTAWKGLVQIGAATGQLAAGVEIFQRLSFSRAEIQATNQEMLQFTETVQKFGVVSGASSTALKAGLTQLGQALSSDVARAEEFNSIMENIPVVGKAIADELDITTGQLRRLVIEGEVLSKDVFAAILNQTEKARQQYEDIPLTVGRATDQLIFQVKQLAFSFDEVTGATSILASFISKITEAVKALNVLVRVVGFAFQEVATRGAAFLLDRINRIIDGVNSINRGLSKIPGVNIGEVSRIGGGQAGEDTFATEANAMTKERIQGLVDEINTLFPAQEQLGNSTRQISQDYQKLAQNLSDTKNKMSEAEKAAKKQADQIKKVTEELEFNIAQLTRTNLEQAIYNNLRAAGVERDTEAGQRIEELTRRYEGLSETLDRQKQFTDSLADSFVDFFDSASTGAESFGDALGNLARSLQKVIYEFYVLQPLKDALTGGSSGGGGGLLGGIISGIGGFFGGGGVTASSFAATQAANVGTGLFGPGFATGGSFTVGGTGGTDSTQVAFRATPGEMVNITRPGQSQGGNVTYNIDARGAAPGVEEKIKAVLMEVRRVDKSIEPRAVGAVRDVNRRNPKYMDK